MTDNSNEIIANLKGFTPGPWERDGICVSKMSRPLTEICLMGNPPQYPGDIGGMMVNSMHNAALIAAAPDLHRIATEQAAEIARLRRCLSDLLLFHDGVPMNGIESERRVDAARNALAAKP